MGVLEPPDGLDRFGIAVLVAGSLQPQLDQVLVRADHVSGMVLLPQLDQLEPLGFGELVRVGHRGRPRLIEQVLADQDADQLGNVPPVGACPVAEQVECPVAEAGPLARLPGGVAELEVVLVNYPPLVDLAADRNRVRAFAAADQQVHELVAEPVRLEP